MNRSCFTIFVFLLIIHFQPNYSILQAQDTTVVQTFTWDSIGRSGYFDFPDDPSKSYEKILMVYNMRCFDAAVGNGSVGCKEWDYSCNTFVHLPEIKDSSIAFAYDYDVSQHNDDYFAYTTETHYTYYAYDKIHTSYKKINSEQSFELDAGFSKQIIANGQPGKMYILYRAGELASAGLTAGRLDGMALNVINGTGHLLSARVRLGITTDALLPANFFPEPDQLTEVYFDDLNLTPGRNRLNFHTSYDWDGTSNLLIELSYDRISGEDVQLSAALLQESNFLIAAFPSETALEFGGSWGIELDPDLFESVEDQITIAFWAFGRPQSLPNQNTTLLEGLDAQGNRTINIHLPWSNSGVYWDCGNNGSSYDRINKTATPEEFEGQWHHWAFTKNSTSGSMKIYLDGKLWHAGESKTAGIAVQSFRLGSSVAHNLGYYGMLDDCSFWKTALDQQAIQTLMTGSALETQEWYPELLAYYDIEEGAGQMLTDKSPGGYYAYFEGGPEWRVLRGRDIHSHFNPDPFRPSLTFFRGNYTIEQEIEQVLDTVVTPKNSVIQYAVNHSQLVAVDTFFVWEAADSKIFNPAGEELESIYVEPEDFLLFEELAYYNSRQGKLELLSLVTPYGNGLDLGAGGKTFTFDVTDFAPVLKGNRRLTVEFGATQEELDIKFQFIEGTPARDVLSIQNIWPFDRGYYDPIQKDKVFEPRQLFIPNPVKMAKIRSSVTGHGQNGEFVARNHRISLNGSQQVFSFELWKECAFNPIYPQGGTWIYDRAGWCPGMPTDLHEFDITPYIDPGQPVGIDYTVFGPYMDQANYLVSNQLVMYGSPNFNLDAAIDNIVRPNQKAVEFARENPNCTDAIVFIQNRGQEVLNSLTITYGVEGISEKNYLWEGSLSFLEKEKVNLPVNESGFWGTEATGQFFVKIKQPNGLTDEYPANDQMHSTYVRPDVYEGNERWLLRVRTNNRAAENKYTLADQSGNIILSRQNLSNNTSYDDEISLPAGCYRFEITDSGNDGLSFWNNPAAGSGWVSIRRIVNESISFEKIKFESDFGGAFAYDFFIDESTGTQSTAEYSRFGLYPNPTFEILYLETEGITGEVRLTITSSAGILFFEKELIIKDNIISLPLNTGELPPGHYYLKMDTPESVWIRPFIKV